MLNALWILLPIFGWFALMGYTIRIVNEFLEGKFEQLPTMQFGSDMKLGFMMFLKALPFAIVYMIVLGVVGIISYDLSQIMNFLFSCFVIPLLGVNFMKKQTVEAYFEFGVLTAMKENLGDYIVMILKTYALAIIFGLMILVLVGFPALMFTSSIFIADFYRRYVKG
ncbi:DUF4013 domain-containing protein [archaeon]|nr:DUF4013 domain-containing protein [archaeon]